MPLEIVKEWMIALWTETVEILVNGFGVRKCFKVGMCKSEAQLNGKTAFVTGGNTGIGFATAQELARRGAKVIIGCRDLGKAHIAIERIRQEIPEGNVSVEFLDLASLTSVSKCAEELIKRESELHILVNNAGVFMYPKMSTEDGFEMHFGVNYLGHFFLTLLLLPKLKQSAPSRIVTVSSIGHRLTHINFEDINLDKSYARLKANNQGQLAKVLFTRQLAKLLYGTQVTTYCLHPGAVRTELHRYLVKWFWMKPFVWFIEFFRWMFFQSATQGAQTVIHCAVDETAATQSGHYYEECKILTTSRNGRNDVDAERLWNISCELVGLSEYKTNSTSC